MALAYTFYASPIGQLKLVATGTGLVAVLWENETANRVPLHENMVRQENAVLADTRRQLEEYFSGARTVFAIPLEMRGTDFQRQVWRALLQIPYGSTVTYGRLARDLGTPDASRAVGAANARNPLSIVVPCHRVVGSMGKLTGFAGGLAAKEYLLQLEGARSGSLLQPGGLEIGAHPA